ncbi:mechanosensitive ion channel family protein [Simkania negevensis]|uniref:Transporter, MscS family n=1 Tax=Simkania negevensis (strain ATCC VR-1471 / DSM 27360 / Z) TaxID=331113 RepID=F8L3T4_SIMNZ|nr:mechanosensitive ion channel domain-containing protein [Simkania negevensis]CCB89956.1 transporter, MscS family [Simkania negevensis Z]
MLQAPLFTIHETPVTVMNLVTFFIVLFVVWIIAKIIKSLVMRMKILKHHVNVATLYGFGRLSYYLVLLVGVYIALMTIGIDLTGIAVVAGALSVGIGFGLQSIFNNFAAGIILFSEKKVRVGDLIQFENGELATVKEINMRSTLVQTLDNRKIVIPNSEIVSKKMTNWTLDPEGYHRFRVPFTVSRKEKKEIIQSLALEVAKKLGATSRAAEVWLTRVTETVQEFELVVWIKVEAFENSSKSLTAECLWNLDDVFAQKGIELLQATKSLAHGAPIQEI